MGDHLPYNGAANLELVVEVPRSGKLLMRHATWICVRQERCEQKSGAYDRGWKPPGRKLGNVPTAPFGRFRIRFLTSPALDLTS